MSDIKQEWEIGISSWIIQDGNYDNFESRQLAEFALEFFSSTVRKVETRTKSSRCLGGAKYEIIGEIAYLTSEVWVLDFGLSAFQKSRPPEGLVVGDFIAAEIYLGIDPFFYFEGIYTLPQMRPLIYSWRIDGIGQQSAPFIETRHNSGRKVMIRDERKLGYKAISKTDAWNDDGGHAEYLLTCTRMDFAPKFKRAKSK